MKIKNFSNGFINRVLWILLLKAQWIVLSDTINILKKKKKKKKKKKNQKIFFLDAPENFAIGLCT